MAWIQCGGGSLGSPTAGVELDLLAQVGVGTFYTCPSDGYMVFVNGGANSNVGVDFKIGSYTEHKNVTGTSNAAGQEVCFVRKGTQVKVTNFDPVNVYNRWAFIPYA